jgi:hypothetical protein
MSAKHIHEPRTNVALRKAWRLGDPAIERDAELFWREQRLLLETSDIGERLKELCLAGYDGEALVALSTVRITYVAFLGVKLAMLRMAVAREQRRNRLGTHILSASREMLEQWSIENPAEAVMGMATVEQNPPLAERGPPRAYLRDAHLNFIGWTGNGEMMRVAWFDHGTVPLFQPEVTASPPSGTDA